MNPEAPGCAFARKDGSRWRVVEVRDYCGDDPTKRAPLRLGLERMELGADLRRAAPGSLVRELSGRLPAAEVAHVASGSYLSCATLRAGGMRCWVTLASPELPAASGLIDPLGGHLPRRLFELPVTARNQKPPASGARSPFSVAPAEAQR